MSARDNRAPRPLRTAEVARAAYSPLTPHRITRERLEHYRAEGRH